MFSCGGSGTKDQLPYNYYGIMVPFMSASLYSLWLLKTAMIRVYLRNPLNEPVTN